MQIYVSKYIYKYYVICVVNLRMDISESYLDVAFKGSQGPALERCFCAETALWIGDEKPCSSWWQMWQAASGKKNHGWKSHNL